MTTTKPTADQAKSHQRDRETPRTKQERKIDQVIERFRPNPLHNDDVPPEWDELPIPLSPPAVHQHYDWRYDPPTEKQLSYLRFLGHAGPLPATKGEASELIGRLTQNETDD